MKIEDITKLNTPEINKFIHENLNSNPEELLLKYSGKTDSPLAAIAEQISCKKKAKKKLPSLAATNFLYEKTALEQSTSEIVANYKKSILKGENLLDLTGGLGIDVLTLSKNFNKVIYCEKNELLVELFKHNLRILEKKCIEVKFGDSIKTLNSFNDNYFDWIYVDPARRDETRRSVDLNYCQPKLIEHIELLEKKSNNICVKLSPAFDFTEAKRIFNNLNEFIVISVNNECKEVLLIIDTDKLNKPITIKSIILKENKVNEIVQTENENYEKRIANNDKQFFYLPDAAIIKAKATTKLAIEFDLYFINNKIDFLIGDKRENFPGRSYQIIESDKYNKKQFKKMLQKYEIRKAQILSKEFGKTSDEMRKQINLKEGTDFALFFTRNANWERYFWICKRISE